MENVCSLTQTAPPPYPFLIHGDSQHQLSTAGQRLNITHNHLEHSDWGQVRAKQFTVAFTAVLCTMHDACTATEQ